jgi:hypothetical protein
MMNLFEGSPVVELHGHHDLPHLGGAIRLEGVTTPQAPDNTGFTTAAHSSFVKAGERWCYPPPPRPCTALASVAWRGCDTPALLPVVLDLPASAMLASACKRPAAELRAAGITRE